MNLRGIESVKQLNTKFFELVHKSSRVLRNCRVSESNNIAISSKIFTKKIENLRSELNSANPYISLSSALLKQQKTQEEALYDFVFVGNTRNIYRESVKYAIQLDLDVRVIGSGWDSYIVTIGISSKIWLTIVSLLLLTNLGELYCVITGKT